MIEETESSRHTPSKLTIFITTVVAVAVLRYAQDIFIPIALATLLSFILAPLIVKLCQWECPRGLAILISVFMALVLIGSIAGVVSLQIIRFTENIPEYQTNIREKLENFKHLSPGFLSELSNLTTSIEKETSTSQNQPRENADSANSEHPLPVEIEQQPSLFDRGETIINPLLGPLGTSALVLIFLISILFQREDLRARFISLVSKGNLNLATQIIDDATHRITTYLVMNLIVNTCYGITIGIGLHYIGVPNAFLWGFLAAFLRFIPYLGAWIALSLPLLLAFAADPGWSMFILTIALFTIIELFTNNLIEPLLYGASTGISSLALMIAAVFWTWLWGIVGLFLSIPLTVCLYVLGKYIPGLEFMHIILGNEPVLNQESALYQRLLAMDEEESLKLSKNFIKNSPIIDYYDQLLIPAMNLAEVDRHNGVLAEHRQKFILEYVSELIEMFGVDDVTVKPLDAEDEETVTTEEYNVICVPARDDADELAARMLSQLLNKEGIKASAIECGALSEANYNFLRAQNPRSFVFHLFPLFQ